MQAGMGGGAPDSMKIWQYSMGWNQSFDFCKSFTAGASLQGCIGLPNGQTQSSLEVCISSVECFSDRCCPGWVPVSSPGAKGSAGRDRGQQLCDLRWCELRPRIVSVVRTSGDAGCLMIPFLSLKLLVW